MTIDCASPPTWTRFDYMNIPVPSLGGAPATARLPALLVRPRLASAPPGPGKYDARLRGQLDTGAKASALPMWLLWQMGVPIDKGTRTMIYGVSGTLWAYIARVGMEILYRDSWLDTGVSNFLVPDTPWPRDTAASHPILLGLSGFFDRVRVCIDRSREEFWLELPAGLGLNAASTRGCV